MFFLELSCFFHDPADVGIFSSVPFSSVTQLCPTLCNPMNRSTPGLSVHHQLLEFTQTHVHRVSDAIQPSHPLLSPAPPAPNPSQHQSFPMKQNVYGCYFRKWPQGAGLLGSNVVTLEMKALWRYLVGEGNENPLEDFCLENSLARETWWAKVHEVAQSRTQLKRLSTLACICMLIHLWVSPRGVYYSLLIRTLCYS